MNIKAIGLKKVIILVISGVISLLCYSCDPATEVVVTNQLSVPILVKVNSLNTSQHEATLRPGEGLSFWILLGSVNNKNVTVKDIYSQLEYFVVQYEDQEVIINKENLLNHEMIKLYEENDHLIMAVIEP